MSATSVSAMITRIKRQLDYNISDTDLDNITVDKINNALKVVKQWLLDSGLYFGISALNSFKTVEDQEYIDLGIARIVGDATTFTGVAGDIINVTVNGTTYAVNVAACTTVALVVTAINTAVGSTVASSSDDGYLVITSSASGSNAVTISDNTGTPASRLFTVSAERTCAPIVNLDEVISLTERTNDKPIIELTYDELKMLYPDPTAAYATTPDFFAKFGSRLYFAPTPSSNILIYIDYVSNVTEVTSASTLPFDNKYDPLIEALCIQSLSSWLDPENRARQTTVEGQVKLYYEILIGKAARNIGQRRSTASRKPEVSYPSPRKVID